MFKPAYKGQTVKDAIFDYMCYAQLKREQEHAPKRIWTIDDLRRRVGCSTTAAYDAVTQLRENLDFKPNWFRTEGGLVMEWLISLK